MPFNGLPGATPRSEWWLRFVRVTLPGRIRALCHRGILLTALFDGLNMNLSNNVAIFPKTIAKVNTHQDHPPRSPEA